MRSKRIKTLLANILTASLILSSSATVFAAPLHKNISAKSVNNMLSNLTSEQRQALKQLESTTYFRISPDINLNSSEKIKVIVQFKQDPAKVEVVKSQIKGKRISLQSAESKVEDSHVQFRQDLNRIMGEENYDIEGLKTNNQLDRQGENEDTLLSHITIHNEFKNAFNGVSMTIPANAIEKLLESDVVKTVWKDYDIKLELPDIVGEINGEGNGLTVRPFMEDSVPHIGVDKLHDQGITGEGIKVGVLDTGIDYNHPDLTNAYQGYRKIEGEDPSTVDPNTVKGWDCIDNDADPMETTIEDWENSPYYPWLPYQEYVSYHGTHVAGTIAGRAENEVPNAVKGVAPDVDLYAYRVLGPQGGTNASVIHGIDKAVADGMDVINLSLGSDVNDPLFPTSVAVNNAMLSGVVTVVAAGNAGPNSYTLGSPGAAPLAITVGASDVPRDVPAFDCLIQNENFDMKLFFKSATETEEELEGKTLSIQYAGLGSLEDFAGKDFTGKIALIQRGELYFVDKMANAKNAGAEAVIIYNNENGDMPFNGEDPVGITTFRLTKEEGENIKAQLDNGEEVQITFNELGTVRTEGDHLAGFSSRGPARQNYDIKPDIVAPGVDIYSTYPEFYFDPEEGVNYETAYNAISGTSMATPHMAGIAALMLQENPEYSPFDVKAVMMNTAEDLNDDYSVYEEGAGRVNAYEAVHSEVLIQVFDKTNSFDENGDLIEIDEITGSIVFGRHYNDGSSIVESRKVNITNNGSENKEFEVSIEFNSEDSLGIGTEDAVENGVTLDIPNTIAVYANDTVEFEPTITLPASAETGIYEGYIRLANKTNADEEYQIPFAIISVERGIDFLKTSSNAICNDMYYSYGHQMPFVDGFAKLRSPMKTLDVIVRDGKTDEPLGYIGSLREGIQADEDIYLPYLFFGGYYPFTDDEENPISTEWYSTDKERHYKIVLVGTDEYGNVYEVYDDVIVDNTPPEFTFDTESEIYELTEDMLTEEINPMTGELVKAFWVHGTVHDSTIDYLNEIGHEEDMWGRPINQSLTKIIYYQNGNMPSGTLTPEPNGEFKFGVTLEEVEEMSQLVFFNIIDYSTCGIVKTPYVYEFTKKDDEYFSLEYDRYEITNDDELTITLNLNNVTKFIGGEVEIPLNPDSFEFVDAKLNPEFEKYAIDNGLDVQFSHEIIQSWTDLIHLSANLEATNGDDFQGINGDIPFIDYTLKYLGGNYERLWTFGWGNGNYSQYGEDETVSMFALAPKQFKINEKYSQTYGVIDGEGYISAGGWLSGGLDFAESDLKVYAVDPSGNKFEGTIGSWGTFEINNLPVIDQEYLVVMEYPGHFKTKILNKLSRVIQGEVVAVDLKTRYTNIPAGDVNGDNVIDILDAIDIHDNYGEYENLVKQDINLDYRVDDIDMSYIYKNYMAVNDNAEVTETPRDEFEGKRLEDVLKYLQDKGIFVGNINAEEGFVAGENVKIKVRAHNFSKKDKDVSLILAVYDENNNLIDYVVKSATVVAPNADPWGPKGYKSITGTVKTTEDAVKVKCFVWDSLDNLEPLVEVFELPVINN